jgi:hypothetical protein
MFVYRTDYILVFTFALFKTNKRVKTPKRVSEAD